MDIEPFDIHDNEDTLKPLQGRCRKKQLKKCVDSSKIEDNLVNRNISIDFNSDTNNIRKQNSTNEKRKRKEFSKLNKKNRNKLNVSIEMCKNAKNSANNVNVEIPVTIHKEIDDNTPNVDNNTPNVDNSVILQPVLSEKVNNSEGIVNTNVREYNISDKNKPTTSSNTYTDKAISQASDDNSLKEKNNVDIPEKDPITLSKATTSNINNYKVPFLKKGLYPNTGEYISKIKTAFKPDNDDIDISIKIGNTLTKIVIKQNKPDVQVKVNQDRAIQTSLGSNQIIVINNNCHSHEVNVNNTKINAEDKNNEGQINNSENKHKDNVQSYTQETISTKKNTVSTNTATAHFDITENVENELSNVMVCENNDKCSLNNTKNKIKTTQPSRLTQISTHSVADIEMVHNNDLDILYSEAIKENNVVPLKDSEYASYEILTPIIKTKLRSQKNVDKREIHGNNDVVDVQIPKKKIKIVTEKVNVNNNTPDIINIEDSDDSDDYDDLMNQVFVNIDADINDIQQSPIIEIIKRKNDANSQVIDSQKLNNTLHPYRNEQCDSDNLFSMIDKNNTSREKNKKVLSLALETTEEIFTPVIRDNLETSPECSLNATEDINDGSDKCVVEDTPQKMQNFIRPKHKHDAIKGRGLSECDKNSVNLGEKENMISCNETLVSVRNRRTNTVIDISNKKESLETSPIINQFVNHKMHKSTPFATKTLRVDDQNVAVYHQPEPEETLCSTAETVVKITQEKELMYKAFEKSPELIKRDNQSRGASECDQISVNLEEKENRISWNETLLSMRNSKNNTVIDLRNKKKSLETPLTINQFVNHIMHKSTPIARKALRFDDQNVAVYHQPELEEAICSTAESVVKITQEKELMYKSFEKSPELLNSSITMSTNDLLSNTSLCIAASCLSFDKLRKLKTLCSERKWVFVDKYVDDLTHLVVAVDEQKKCIRSVKYMRALAASKWIVSFEWAEKCLIAEKYVDESEYEALDATGEPGPKRSRISKKKLFEGITFFCMPPFSLMDLNSLKEILINAGGVVVNEAKKVRRTDRTKGLHILIAEHENSQDDQFMKFGLKLNFLPINFEWILDCLGVYSLESIQDLL